jgi:hypothetical protein
VVTDGFGIYDTMQMVRKERKWEGRGGEGRGGESEERRGEI